MLDPTPIPDPYVVAVITVAAAAPGAISSLVWSASHARGTQFLPVHVGVIAAVLTLAAATFGFTLPSGSSLSRAAAVLAAGLAVFAASVAAERAVAAWVRRRGGYVTHRSPQGASPLLVASGPGRIGTAPPRFVPGWLVAVAVGEELLYRGILLNVAELAPAPITAVAVPLSVLLFAAAHLPLGRGNALIMLVLGGSAMFAVLLSDSLLPAVLGHVAYNLRAGRALP